MWWFIKVKDEDNCCRTCIVKTTCSQTTHTIMLCDLINGWIESLPLENLLDRCKKLNPLLEASPDRLVAHVTSLLDGLRGDVERTLFCREDSYILRLKSKLVGVPFLFEFHLEELDAKNIYSHVTTPILATLLELHERHNSLIKIIKKKDAEIAEYKINGAQLSRKNLETPVFNEDEFARKCLESSFSDQVVSDVQEHLFTPSMQKLFADVLLKLDRSTGTAKVTSAEDSSATNNELRAATTEMLEPSSTTQLAETVPATEAGSRSSVPSSAANGEVSSTAPGTTQLKPVDADYPDTEAKVDVRPPKKKKYNHKMLGL